MGERFPSEGDLTPEELDQLEFQMFGIEAKEPVFVAALRERIKKEGMAGFPYRVGQHAQVLNPKTKEMEDWQVTNVDKARSGKDDFDVIVGRELRPEEGRPDQIILRRIPLGLFFTWNRPEPK